MNIQIKKAISEQDIKDCLQVRRKVFIEGQNISEKDELDGLERESDNYLVILDDEAIGTARVRYLQENGKIKAKVERVAVLSEYQGKGIGKRLMAYILGVIEQNKKVTKLKLSAQSYIVPFYKNLGYRICSEEYMEAGIPHTDMERDLEASE